MFNFSVKTTLSNRFKVLLFNYFLTILLIVVSVISLNATNYYVSSSGSDSNSGTSESQPWRSLTKVNSFTPKPGDQILFKRGDEWIGTITVNGSGASSNRIIYGAYGTGEKPKIYGSEKITGWTKHSGNIYKASFGTAINQLFINDNRARAARYPNNVWFLTTSVNSATQFTCNSINSGINYKGAKLIIKTNEWRLDTRDVISSNSQTISFNENLVYTLEKARPFFFTNKLEFLDQAGEWYYDNTTKTVYFWAPNGDTPNNYIVRGSTSNNGVVVSGKSYVTIRDLEILQHSANGIDAYTSTSNIIIDNNEIYNSDVYGIKSQGTANIISNNKLDGINSVGIMAWNSANGEILENEILNTGVYENIGVNGMVTGYTTAIRLSGNGQNVKNNRIVNCGYIGINLSGLNTHVENNYIENTCSILFDGGAIYSWSSDFNEPLAAGSVIKNNIAMYNNGTATIFMDDRTQNVTIEGNTVAHTTGSRYHSKQTVAYGIFLINNKNVQVKSNTLFNNARNWSLKGIYEGNMFNNNIVCNIKTTPPSGYLEAMLSHKNTTQNNCSFNYNTYIDRHRTKPFRFDDTGINLTFNDWKAGIKSDISSTFIGTALATGETEELFYNDTKQTKIINLGSYLYKDIYGKQVSQSLTLEPFTSKILIKTTTVIAPDITPPTVSSFSIPSNSNSFIVPVTNFTATDNNAVTGFLITESSSSPNASNANWSASAPSSFTFVTGGTKTLYAWSKDAAGNISASKSAQVVVTLPSDNTGILGNTEVSNLVSNSPNRRAVPVIFNETAIVESISIYHNGGTGNVLLGVYSDLAGSPSTQLGTTNSTLINTATGWQTISLINPVMVSSGQTVWLSWVFQNNPGIRYSTGSPGRAQSDEVWSGGMPETFGTSSVEDYKYSIYCNTTKPFLDVSSTNVLLESDTGAKGTFNITSNASWSLSDNADWLELSSSAGLNNATITATANSANPGSSQRTATITVSAQGLTSKTIIITQKNKTSNTNTQGNQDVYNLVSTSANRRAIPVTFMEKGEINSISVYHNGGTGSVLLGVYSDNSNAPSVQLGVTSSTAINSTSGWQTVSLNSPIKVNSGETVWLSWVFQNNPGVRYAIGTPGRSQSSDTWSAGMPSTFGETSHGDYNYSIYCTYTPDKPFVTVGNTEVFSNVSTAPNRRAVPVTFSETGMIESISIYHNGGIGNVLLGVYSNQSESPSTLLGITAATEINSTAGWQTISLKSPIPVNSGQTIWLSWVFQNNPGIRYKTGIHARTQSTETWIAGMPTNFGTSSFADYDYSIHCNLAPGLKTFNSENTVVYDLITTAPNKRAVPVTFSEGATINSITIYHNGGTGNVLLGVYSDQSGSPSSSLGVTAQTAINSTEGWQTVSLESPVSVYPGQTIWLAWVFENNPGLRYMIGAPARAQSIETWSSGLSSSFGDASFADYYYSIYCTYTPNTAIDKTKPIISDFSIPATSSSLTVTISTFLASDYVGVTGFKLTETSTTPLSTDPDWFTEAPVSYTFNNEGTKILYAWTKDAAGNISLSKNRQVIISLPTYSLGHTEVYSSTSTESNRRAVPVTFNENGEIKSLSIFHNGGNGNVILGIYSDQNDSPLSRLGVTASTVINSTAGWQTIPLSSPVAVSAGETVWLSWVFQNNPGIRYTIGTPARVQSTDSWTAGMPASFGAVSFADYQYSIYCTYIAKKGILKGATIPDVENFDLVETPVVLFDSDESNNSIVENNIYQSGENDFRLYPNPAKSVINIDLIHIPDGEAKVVIIDNSGRTVFSQQVESSISTINISQFNAGMYFVKLISPKLNITKKLIITN